MIHFEGVSKVYEGQTALANATFSVERGEMLFITGPSGAGKSTLLKLIYHAVAPEEGSITINGQRTDSMRARHIPALRRNIGVVFQDFRLLSGRTIYENVALAMRIRDAAEAQVKAQVMETLKMVGLRHKADAYPDALSGGEQQRVVIARAIVADPIIVLADEPTGNLDPVTAAGIMRIFKDINSRGTTIVIATHNKDLYANTGRRVLRLDSGAIAGEDRG
ncbi:MAG: cell division ATP-binding protein FtsE [Nitrospiraceae bacterium]|nr:cell division ATP-binding protein FtsE [Nitrospiraceae bacterium]